MPDENPRRRGVWLCYRDGWKHVEAAEMNEPPDFGLTDREYRVLSLIADGMDDQEIAGALAVSSFTVESDVQAIIRKLGAGSRTEAAVRALKSGLIR